MDGGKKEALEQLRTFLEQNEEDLGDRQESLLETMRAFEEQLKEQAQALENVGESGSGDICLEYAKEFAERRKRIDDSVGDYQTVFEELKAALFF